ncbi:amino acid ABC transporter permease [Alicyclobacillus tolerans]|uniref:amino acid ABC transporter permease n=1 Tax=Alicyclobacillus tolerans TaxID=90970 RepID=UPI001F27D091|nr:amino acid ABC transporter permease [Alicyclobacillus tolerans]MCF8565245.1 amino acid ABC transporter permease [Alicyclobacillus tolerans]
MVQLWIQYLPQMWKGVWMTLELTVAALILALVLGFVLAFARLSRFRVLNLVATWYTEIVRAVPVLVILFIVYYSLGNILKLSGILSAVISLGAFYATQYGEIFRGAILGVDRGQTEAAFALGMTNRTIMRKVILPQAFFSILPPSTNQLSNLIKDTSLVFTIGVADLMFQAYQAASATFLPLDMLLLAGVIYFVFYLILSKFLARWELNVQRSRS